MTVVMIGVQRPASDVVVMVRKEEGGRACKRFDQVGTFPALAIFRPVAPPPVALEM
jgi:hypothetical protein